MKNTRTLKIAAMVILGLMVAYWLMITIGALFSGLPGWAGNLLQITLAVLLGLLGWKRPLLGGALLVLGGVVIAVYFLLVLYHLQEAAIPLFAISIPMALSGLLLVEADWQGRKANR